jgi:hypothetical protein
MDIKATGEGWWVMVAHMWIHMLEEHTIQLCFYYQYGLRMKEFLGALDIHEWFPLGAADGWCKLRPKTTKAKTKYPKIED